MIVYLLYMYVTFVHVVCVCGGEPKNKYEGYYSCLTKYESMRGDVRRIDFRDEKCKSINIWMFHRHGTRYPSMAEIIDIRKLSNIKNDILSNHRNGQGSLTPEQLQRILEWEFAQGMNIQSNNLTESGWNETRRIALRFKEKFPNLFDKNYSAKSFYFQHTDSLRTLDTFRAFSNALFGENSDSLVEDHFDPIDLDKLLIPYRGACPKLAELNQLRDTYGDKFPKEFKKTEDFSKTVSIVSKRLGFSESLSVDYFIPIFSACAYESAWYQETNPVGAWCPALGNDAHLTGEYYVDLAFVESSGYYNDIAVKTGCSPFQDLWYRFATAVGEMNAINKTEPVVVLFAHDMHLIAMLSNLGLMKDNPTISPYNYLQQQNRLWRTSEMIPFAANIVAVLQKCLQSNGNYEHEVVFLRNEKPFEGIAGCPGGICSWKEFKNLFKPIADKCNFEEFC